MFFLNVWVYRADAVSTVGRSHRESPELEMRNEARDLAQELGDGEALARLIYRQMSTKSKGISRPAPRWTDETAEYL
jgi:hypothetical protein